VTRLALILAAILAGPALAEPNVDQKVDQRALDDCSAQDPAFTRIAECLPGADVGVAMLDFIAGEAVLGADGAALASECLALNEGEYAGAWSCARNAIRDAVKLGAMLPEGATIPDARFAPLNRPDLEAAIDAAEDTAQAKFPDVMLWGGNMYRRLK